MGFSGISRLQVAFRIISLQINSLSIVIFKPSRTIVAKLAPDWHQISYGLWQEIKAFQQLLRHQVTGRRRLRDPATAASIEAVRCRRASSPTAPFSTGATPRRQDGEPRNRLGSTIRRHRRKKLQPTPALVYSLPPRSREVPRARRYWRGPTPAAFSQRREAQVPSLAAKGGRSREVRADAAEVLDAYMSHPEDRAVAAVDADQIFKRPSPRPADHCPEVPAVDLTPDQVLDMLRRLIEANKGMYVFPGHLRAAFQCALDVHPRRQSQSSSSPSASSSTWLQTRRSPQFDRADQRPFSKAELQAGLEAHRQHVRASRRRR